MTNVTIDAVPKRTTLHHLLINKSHVSVLIYLTALGSCTSKLFNAYSFMYHLSLDQGVQRAGDQ